MATSQPTSSFLYIVYRNYVAGNHYFQVVGEPVLIAQYQATLNKPFFDKDGVSMYCTKDPEAALIQTGRLVQWKRGDGSMGFVHDLDQYRAMRDLAAKQPPSLVEFFMGKAIATVNCEIPAKYLAKPQQPEQPQPEPQGEVQDNQQLDADHLAHEKLRQQELDLCKQELDDDAAMDFQPMDQQ